MPEPACTAYYQLMPEGVLSPFLSHLSSQSLLTQAWPVSASFSALTLPVLPGSLLKGTLAFSSRPGVWFRQQQKMSWQIKGSRVPELQCTWHLYLLRHSPRLWQGWRRRRGGEEEKMEDTLLHSCVFTLTGLIRKRGGRTRWSTLEPSISSFQHARLSTHAEHRKMHERGHFCCCWNIQINVVFSWICQIIEWWLFCDGQTCQKSKTVFYIFDDWGSVLIWFPQTVEKQS